MKRGADRQHHSLTDALLFRQLNRSFIWELGVAYERDKYSTAAIRTTTALTTLRWRLGPRLALRFIYAYSTISEEHLSQNQIGITASYALTEAAESSDTLMHPMTPNSPAMQPPLRPKKKLELAPSHAALTEAGGPTPNAIQTGYAAP